MSGLTHADFDELARKLRRDPELDMDQFAACALGARRGWTCEWAAGVTPAEREGQRPWSGVDGRVIVRA